MSKEVDDQQMKQYFEMKKYWRSWGSWFSWGSPVGLSIFFLSVSGCIWILAKAF